MATVKKHPPIGEVFELELDANVDGNTPLGMVEAFGYNPLGWRFTGATLIGRLRKKFKLVQIGYRPNPDAAKTALEAEYGPTPQGQWMKAFKDAYPEAGSKGPVGVTDVSWVHPNGHASFPYVDSRGLPIFNWAGDALDEDWRWLVAVPEGK